MNLRASAIVMKSLPATAWGDALLISREEARRIGYELEQAAERIEALEARATPALPQGVEEWIHHHWVQFDTAKFERFVPVDDLTAYLSGMAIVPVELLKEAVGQLSELNTFAAIRAIIDNKENRQ